MGRESLGELASALAVLCPSLVQVVLSPLGPAVPRTATGTPRQACPSAAPALGSCRHATGQTAKAAGQTAEVPGSCPTATLLSSSRLTRAALVSLTRPPPTLRGDGTCPFTIHCYQLLPPTQQLKLFVNANGRQRFHSTSWQTTEIPPAVPCCCCRSVK